MIPIPRDTPLDRIGVGTCQPLGAVFLTYTFDTVFFEEEVLATLLTMTSDPEDSPRGFVEEGTRKLQETPVVVMVDSGHIRGGRRLPYDLLPANRSRTFHPKLVLLLYVDQARLLVGSGNLTPGGYGGNAETGVVLTLRYGSDEGLIQEVMDFLNACGLHGEAWDRFQETLENLRRVPDTTPRTLPRFMHSLSDKPILEQFFDGLPDDARVHSAGILAPFHQEDGAQPERAVLDRIVNALAGKRRGKLPLDVGLSWEQNPVGPTVDETTDLEGGRGRLWAIEEGGTRNVETHWFILGERDGWNRQCDHGHKTQLRSTRELNQGINERWAWMVGPVAVAGPRGLIERVGDRAELSLFVHPEFRKEEGRIIRQPLHAKLLVVALTAGKQKVTHLLVGSPNASARALLDSHGNVECAVHLVLKGHHRLPALCPNLVPCPMEQVNWTDRTYPDPAPNPATWLEDVWYEPEPGRLTVHWKEGAPLLKLSYPQPDGSSKGLRCRMVERKLKKTFAPFELHPGILELIVEADGAEGRFPIRLVQLLDLPVLGPTVDWSFEDLVGLYAGRYSVHGLYARGGDRTPKEPDIGGEGGGLWRSELPPREVFRALFTLAKEVADPDLSPGAFTMLMQGPTGLEFVSRQLVDAAAKGSLQPGEVWVYGHELISELSSNDLGNTPFSVNRRKLIEQFSSDLRRQLKQFRPPGPLHKPLALFYGGVD